MFSYVDFTYFFFLWNFKFNLKPLKVVCKYELRDSIGFLKSKNICSYYLYYYLILSVFINLNNETSQHKNLPVKFFFSIFEIATLVQQINLGDIGKETI